MDKASIGRKLIIFMGAVAIATAIVSLLTLLGYFDRPKMTDLQPRAEAGDLQAQFKLGLCYLNGEGVVKNYVEAYKWVFLSRDSDPVRADRSCKFTATKMTAEQIADAKAKAVTWQEKFKQSHPAKK